MTRKKVKLAYISNDSARKATYKKRKKGLIKKVNEISTLCGVDACLIIYSPYEAQPEVWPPSVVAVQRVLGQFRRMPEMEQSKKMVNQETFLRQRIMKIKDQLKKQLKDNREKEMIEVMFQCLTGKDLMSLSMMDFNDLAWLVDQYSREIDSRSEKLMKAEEKAVQTTTTGTELAADTKPPIHDVSPLVNPTGGPFPNFEVMQTAPWFSQGYNDASSSNNHQMGLHNDNIGGMWPNNPNFFNM